MTEQQQPTIVGVDGRAAGRGAVAWAVRRAGRLGGPIRLVFALDFAEAPGLDSDEQLRAAASRLLAAELDWARQLPEAADVPLDGDVVEGDATEVLAEHSTGAAALVIGSDRSLPARDLLVGTRGMRVAALAHAPVAVIPPQDDGPDRRDGVVVGVGPDDSATAALSFAAAEAERLEQPLTLVSAWGIPPALERIAQAMGGGLQPVGDGFAAQLADLARRLHDAHPTVEVRTESVNEAPVRALVSRGREAVELVVGSHRHGAVGRLLLGSVGQGVLLNLPGPTVVVPV
jgi:nucleotide-binding universal stress UspA family protein